jgi:hypothetical protein
MVMLLHINIKSVICATVFFLPMVGSAASPSSADSPAGVVINLTNQAEINASAIATLISEAASGANDEVRAEATHELWLRAADSGFKDTRAVNALETLANDDNEAVSRIAGEALDDMSKALAR